MDNLYFDFKVYKWRLTHSENEENDGGEKRSEKTSRTLKQNPAFQVCLGGF